MNKLMTTYKQYIKNNFIVPLRSFKYLKLVKDYENFSTRISMFLIKKCVDLHIYVLSTFNRAEH